MLGGYPNCNVGNNDFEYLEPTQNYLEKIGQISRYYRIEFKDDKRPYFQGDKYNFNMKSYSNEKMILILKKLINVIQKLKVDYFVLV